MQNYRQGCWATSESESCGTGDCPNDSSNGEARPDEVQPFKPEDVMKRKRKIFKNFNFFFNSTLHNNLD